MVTSGAEGSIVSRRQMHGTEKNGEYNQFKPVLDSCTKEEDLF